MFLKQSLMGAALAVCATSAFAENIVVHGSTTVDSNLFAPYKQQLENMTGDTYEITANGSSGGVRGVHLGFADVGMISSDLSSVLAKLKLTDYADSFEAKKIGEERITYAVHPSNKVRKLKRSEIVGMMNGDITNWSEVGGADKPVVILAERIGGGVRATIDKKLLKKNTIDTLYFKETENGAMAVKYGEMIPLALVAVPSSMLRGSDLVIVENDAEIVQPLYFVSKGKKQDAFNRLVESSKDILSE